MKTMPVTMRVFALLTFTLSGSPLAAWAAAVQAGSTIQSVTVYPESARITRMAKVSLPVGESEIRLSGLPLNLDESSLRVSGQSVASVALGSVQLQQAVSADVVQEREKQLRDDIDKWKRKRQEVVDAKTRAEQQIEFIRAAGGLGNPPMEEDAGATNSTSSVKPLPMAQWQQAWQMLDAATAEAQSKIRDADKTINEFDKGIAQLQGQLAQVATGNTSSRTATLHVKADQATDLSLSLNYQIRGASWMPVYDAELNSENGKLNLKSLAEIRQTTGEDWTNVAVILSTLRPASNAALPELDSWTINFEPENIYTEAGTTPRMAMKAMREAAPADMEMMAEPVMVPAPVPMPMVAMESALTSGDYNAEYKVPGTLTLASGNDTRRVTLASRQMDSKLSLNTVPRFDARAILTSKAEYEGDAPLIPGPVALYRDGNFVGNGDLPSLQKGEDIKLSFGEDDRVKVKFNALPENTTEKGLLSTRENRERQYEVTVENHHNDDRTVMVYDNIPVSEHENIKVVMHGEKPEQTDIDGKKGVDAWKLDVDAGDKAILKYGYTVSFPQDKRVSGL